MTEAVSLAKALAAQLGCTCQHSRVDTGDLCASRVRIMAQHLVGKGAGTFKTPWQRLFSGHAAKFQVRPLFQDMQEDFRCGCFQHTTIQMQLQGQTRFPASRAGSVLELPPVAAGAPALSGPHQESRGPAEEPELGDQKEPCAVGTDASQQVG